MTAEGVWAVILTAPLPPGGSAARTGSPDSRICTVPEEEKQNEKRYMQKDSSVDYIMSMHALWLTDYLCLYHALPLESHGAHNIWYVKLTGRKMDNIILI